LAAEGIAFGMGMSGGVAEGLAHPGRSHDQSAIHPLRRAPHERSVRMLAIFPVKHP